MAERTQPHIEVENLSIHYGDVTAVAASASRCSRASS